MEETMMTTARYPALHSFRNPTTPFPTWKLYDNPFYSSTNPAHRCTRQQSARRLAASLWGLAFCPFERPMDSDAARLLRRVEELEAEVELERRLRKKAEQLNRRLARELEEERAALNKACVEMEKHIAAEKAAVDRMRKEMEEERKMLRLAEVWREERVQMKLNEVRLLMEEQLAGLSKVADLEAQPPARPPELEEKTGEPAPLKTASGMIITVPENTSANNNINLRRDSQRRTQPETENPHIKRGTTGFVEFPRGVRASGSRGRQLGSKVECQKAQLRVLLRHKRSPTAGLAVAVAGADSVLVG